MNGVAFADDLAVAKQEYATTTLCTAMGVITRWCAESGMKIAQEKTEVILLTGKRFPKVIEINVAEYILTTKQEDSVENCGC